MPGMKKSIGETLWDALMPLQPAPSSVSAADIARSKNLEFNLTVTEYNWPKYARNI